MKKSVKRNISRVTIERAENGFTVQLSHDNGFYPDYGEKTYVFTDPNDVANHVRDSLVNGVIFEEEVVGEAVED